LWALNVSGRAGILDEVLATGINSGLGNDHLRIQGMKYMLDGSLGGKTAAVASAYEDSDSYGILYNTLEEFAPAVRSAIHSGLRVAIHAIGERAIDVAVTAIEQADAPESGANVRQMRNRIEHCGLPTDEHLERIAGLGLVA